MVQAQWGTFIIRINESGDGSEIGDSTKESTRNSNDGGGMDSKDKTCPLENTAQAKSYINILILNYYISPAQD